MIVKTPLTESDRVLSRQCVIAGASEQRAREPCARQQDIIAALSVQSAAVGGGRKAIVAHAASGGGLPKIWHNRISDRESRV